MNTRRKREEKYEGCTCLERTDKTFVLSVCVSVFVLKRSPANPNNREEIHCQLGFLTSLLIPVMLNYACGYYEIYRPSVCI